ncbi:MAG: pilus assembly protein PilM [Thermodesulfovibrionales bacterium]|nr:pilus assembly protein PilM [Thermodesulfovibrionales bacterium]
MGFFRPVQLGVDLGGSSIKVAEVKGKKVVLAAYADIPKEIRENEAFLIGALREFLSSIGAQGRQGVVQLPAQLAFVRAVNFPPMPHAELKEAVKWEIKRQLPYPLEEAVHDYVAVETAEGIAVTFASAERRAVQRYLFPFREAGLDVTAVDVSPMCLIRSLKPRSPGNAIILDIGGLSTEINIIKGGVLRITRTVELGGDFIKQHFKDGGAGAEEAEKILMEGGEDELKVPLDEFLREVTRSMDYYQANFKEKTFSDVILTGGVAINPGVRSYFLRALDMPVSVPDPFEGLVMADETMRRLGPRFSVAVGLAGRSE